jgi:hypothetical protein
LASVREPREIVNTFASLKISELTVITIIIFHSSN